MTCGPAAAQAPAAERVVLDTSLGQIEIEVDAAHAPHDAALFLRYVDLGLLDDAMFRQVVRLPAGELRRGRFTFVAAEIDSSHREEASRTSVAEPHAPRLPTEPGSVSLMPSMRDPKVFDLAICLTVGEHDDGFLPFGTIVRGLDVVRRIADGPAHGQQLDAGVRILRARRVHEE